MVRRIHDHIQFLEKFINNINALTAQMLKDLQNEYEISLEQSHVLSILHSEPLTISEITERQGVNKAAVSRRIKKLIDANLVKIDKPKLNVDQRLKFIALTPKGQAYVDERNAIMNNIANDITNDFEDEEIENVRYILEVINKRIEAYNLND
ncbi:MarR family transcriptional regulator [Staphylococcus simiae]|uniref:MarR family winged helix-turn-helix transcriptional regulator n=1 Tax=Staphylococcus simiae TaxID=308354 RepID=UPI001A963CB5|nr:MarR family transcriptional regulator [Staphylococcus simiae]MBO1198670.1 MarR family transcriptional regulator [Staphylococcus simiae]MBO1200845.1 MarR family transcriptional regulator [Staphylococcus simiae]MBO1203053.1 MarR family transcriptional regulator [Staphylococcus simiae]MBO1211296.1 MarR family transcriptional regulator [Staphylococcus simiae]MBO1229181.1 MarR family transcriptional regulator [Staphylococcus simiae]